MLRIAVIPAALILLLAGMMVWSGGATERKADFSYIDRGEVGTLDPNRMSWNQDIRVGYALWEGLYTLDPQTLEAIPGCADPIDISRDKTVYTFHLRPAAKWSNGDPVQAHDFVFAWRRMLEEPGDYTYLLHYIRGAEDYEKAFDADDLAKPADFSKVAIEELNPLTLRVSLIHPVACFPDVCAFPCCFPLNEKSMERFRTADTVKTNSHAVHKNYDKQFTRPPNLVTNGAYRLADWQYRRRMRLEANPFYWDKANVKSKIIDKISSDDQQWAYEMYNSGGADWLVDESGEIGAELFAKHRSDLRVFPAFGTYFYSFNCNEKLNDGRPNPFHDVRVRQALSISFDKNTIVQKITRLGETPSDNYIPPGAFPGYKEPRGLRTDIPKARQLLADAGYPLGKGFPEISLLFNNEGNHAQIAQSVRRQWMENLGIDIRLEGIEVKVFQNRMHNKDYAICRASWFGDYNDPSTFTDKYKIDSGNNDSNWINQKYQHLCELADVEADKQKRLDYFSQAEQILLDEAPILPVFTYVNAYMFRDDVKGLPLNIRGMQMFKSIERVQGSGLRIQ
jgi:oligopeptide transport system substrate-binding protein